MCYSKQRLWSSQHSCWGHRDCYELNTCMTSSWINLLFAPSPANRWSYHRRWHPPRRFSYAIRPYPSRSFQATSCHAICSWVSAANSHSIHGPMCISESSGPTPRLPSTSLPTSHSGWSPQQFLDHCELAALELVTLEAARLRSGWKFISRALSSHLNKSTHCRRLESDNASVDRQHQAFIFLLPMPNHNRDSQHNDPDDTVSQDRRNLVSKQLAEAAEAEETARGSLIAGSYDPYNCANRAYCKFQVPPSEPVDLNLFI